MMTALNRIAHLTAEQKASADSLTAAEFEKGDMLKVRDLQEASDHLELTTSQRDTLAEKMQLPQERLSTTESELALASSAQCKPLETQEALQNERDASTRMVQGLEAKYASVSEENMQLECKKHKNEQRIAAEVKHRELQLELQSAEEGMLGLQTKLTASRAETYSQQQMKQESEDENTLLKADFDKALSSTKDTIAQLKDKCARSETTLQTKETALQTVKEEVQTLQQTNGELVESLACLRAEYVHINEAHERIKLQENERELERQQWRENRYELETQIDERARDKEMERQAEEERKRESDEARQRILQQIEEAKAVSGGWRGGAEGGGGAHALDSLMYLHRSFQPPEARRNSGVSHSEVLEAPFKHWLAVVHEGRLLEFLRTSEEMTRECVNKCRILQEQEMLVQEQLHQVALQYLEKTLNMHQKDIEILRESLAAAEKKAAEEEAGRKMAELTGVQPLLLYEALSYYCMRP
jgi:acetolactate synthase small subunit